MAVYTILVRDACSFLGIRKDGDSEDVSGGLGERSSNEGGRVGKGRISLDRVGQTPPKSRAWREIESGDNTADTPLEAEIGNGYTWKLVTLIAWISLSKTFRMENPIPSLI